MLSNYTIKQALPRLIIAAVAINLSYYICGLAVDISNVLGQSLYHLLSGLAGGVAIDAKAIVPIFDSLMAGSAAVGLPAGVITAIVGAAVPAVGGQLLTGIALLFVGVALGIAFAILIALVILAARQAIVVILIVVSPVAFALYVLPGTKPLFDKWRKLLTTMLVFFPLFGILYGGAQLAGTILISVGSQKPGPSVTDPTGFAASMLLMGLAAQFAPLFLTPWLLKNSTGMLGQLAGRLQQGANRLSSAVNTRGRRNLGEAGTRAWRQGANALRSRAARSTRPLGRFTNWAMSGGARREAVDKALEAEHKQHNAEYVESSGRYDAYAQRAGTAQDLTQASEARTEAARLTTGAGSAARQVRDNAQKRQKTQENTVERARVQSREGRAVDHDAKNSGEDLKAAENDSEIRRLATPQGRQATQNRKNTEGLLQGTEADVERDRLTTPAGQRSYEFQKNFEGRLEAQQHDSETLRLGTTAGEAVESAKEDAAGNLKVAQNEVKTLRLQNSASQAIEHSVHRAEDNLKTAELGVKTSGLQTVAGQASAGALKAAELDANLSRAAIENPVETAHVIANRDDYANVKQSSLSASMERSIAENQGELQHLADERNDLYLRQAASQGQVEDAKASQDQLVSELKTEKGQSVHAKAVDSNVADIIYGTAQSKKEHSMAQQTAERAATIEHAEAIVNKPTTASAAGGNVDSYGAARATAAARDTLKTEFNQIVAQEKSTMSKTKPTDVLAIMKDPSQSVERRAAAAGELASGGWRGGHLELIEYLTDPANASIPGIADLQQQAFADMRAAGTMPTTLGDTMKTQLGNGELHIQPRTLPDGSQLSIREEMLLQRLEDEKFSESSMSTLDPDEARVLTTLNDKGVFSGGPNTNTQAASHLESVLGRLRKEGNTYYGKTKDAVRDMFDEVVPPTPPGSGGGS